MTVKNEERGGVQIVLELNLQANKYVLLYRTYVRTYKYYLRSQ